MQTPLTAQSIPSVTADQMRRVDRLALEKYGIQVIQMMENAGRSLAELSRRFLNESVAGRHIIIAAGRGNNGGGGMAAARHLHNMGAKITLLLQTRSPIGDSEIQLRILKRLPVERKIGAQAKDFLSSPQGDLVIDALIGYGLLGKPHGWMAEIINALNSTGIPIIALDAPSGLDVTTGEVYDPCIKAYVTMTLALPKIGLLNPDAKKVVGKLYLSDIGIPTLVYREIGLSLEPIFLNGSLLSLDEKEGEKI